MSKNINLFVSHKGEDENRIDDFKNLMSKKGYNFRDSSIRESDPNNANNKDYIKNSILKPAIDWAGKVVVLIGKETYKSEWVNWEIEYAIKKNYKIIGVFLPGEKDAELPDALKDFGDGCVGWNSDRIDQALTSDDPIWEDSNGNPFAPNNTNRATC